MTTTTPVISKVFKELQKVGYAARQNLKATTTWDSINHPMYRYLHSKAGNQMTHRWDMSNVVVQGAIWTQHDNSAGKNGVRVYYAGSQTEATNRPTTHEVGKAIEASLNKHGIPIAGHYTSDVGNYILIPPHSMLPWRTLFPVKQLNFA